MPPTAVPSTSATHSASRSSRIAPHSHIRGLGLRPEGVADSEAAGFVGQTAAREVIVWSDSEDMMFTWV
jgi:RuvB-like protein 1